MQEKLRDIVRNALEKSGVSDIDFDIEHPNAFAHGDYSTNAALVAAKKNGKDPKECAKELISHIEKSGHIEKIDIAGPGFINFHLSKEFFVDVLSGVLKTTTDWGKNEHQKGKRIMIEYTDPNPFKAFHIGHLMNNAIGESIARLIEYSGAAIVRANYQGDVGPHVAKAIWGKQQRSEMSWGEAYAYGAGRYEEHKQEIDGINAKLYEKSDKALNELYEKGRKESLEQFEKIYEMLGTRFDQYYFESETWKEGVQMVKEHVGNVFEESDGAIVFRGEKRDKTLHTRVFMNSEGIPTYEAKDIGLALKKEKAGDFDTLITITAEEQKEYFKVIIAALQEIDPEVAKKVVHLSHGMMRLPSGKMSSRTGDVIAAEDLIEEVKNAVLAIESERDIKDKEKNAEIIAIAALKYMILRQAPSKDIVYDIARSISFEGDSGPYLQYAHTRAQSILEKAKNSGVPAEGWSASGRNSRVTSNLERLLYRFPEVVERSAESYEPHHVTNYLTELAGAFNSFYAGGKIIGGENEAYDLALTRAFQITMQNGLYLLGIRTPERM